MNMKPDKTGIIGLGRAGGLLFKIFRHQPLYTDIQKNLSHPGKFTGLRELVRKSGIIFISVPDDKISTIVKKIALFKVDLKGKIILHLSGSYSSEILTELRATGASTGSLHPALSIADHDWIIRNLKKFVWTIEGEKMVRRKIKRLMKRYSVKVFPISEKKKGIYHLACVFLSNLPVFNPEFGGILLRETGLEERVTRKLGHGLVLSLEHNLIKFSDKRMITGPLVRGDVKTIRNHLKILKEKDEMFHWYINKCRTAAEKFNLKNVSDFLRRYP
ncbi:MAG TPA: DUF2520 domain-containing protein [Firmicutes bacterium]|nr:DUF2520 domain-containing protein [Bacillota bacterium]